MYSLRPFRRGRVMPGFDDDFFSSFWEGSQNFGFKVDIKEEGDKYLLQAELPGMDKSKINIEMNGNYLVISAKNDEVYNKEEDNSYIRRERRVMSCERQFYVGEVKPEEIDAKYNNGVLEIRIPQKDKNKYNRHQIQIQ